MEEVEQMGQYYTAMLKTICGNDYDKVQAASHIAEAQYWSDVQVIPSTEIQSGKMF
jgi:hypothetical protein